VPEKLHRGHPRGDTHGRLWLSGSAFTQLLNADNDHSNRNTQNECFDEAGLTTEQREDDYEKADNPGSDIGVRSPTWLFGLVVHTVSLGQRGWADRLVP
jgi:hypothetical protein